MPDKNFTRNVPKNYQSFIAALPGSNMWRHLYVIDQNDVEIDVAENGNKSCAYIVSSVLRIFNLIDTQHATVQTTLKHMLESGWYKIDKPVAGAVVEWQEHMGFYLADDSYISNNSNLGYVTKHKSILEDGRRPIGFYIHKDLIK